MACLAVPEALTFVRALALTLRQRARHDPVLGPRAFEPICGSADDVAEAEAGAVQEHPAVEVVAPEGRGLVHAHPLEDAVLLLDLDGAVGAVGEPRPRPLLLAVVPVFVVVDVGGALGGGPAQVGADGELLVDLGAVAVDVHVLVLGVVRDADVAPRGFGLGPHGVADTLGFGYVAFHVHESDTGTLDVALPAGPVVLEVVDEAPVGCNFDDVGAAEGVAAQPAIGFLLGVAVDPVGDIVASWSQSRVDGAHGIGHVADGSAVRGADHGLVALAHQGVAEGPDDLAVDDAGVAEVAGYVMLVAPGVEEAHAALVVDLLHLGRHVPRAGGLLALLRVRSPRVRRGSGVAAHWALLGIFELCFELVERFVHVGQVSPDEVEVGFEWHLWRGALACDFCGGSR